MYKKMNKIKLDKISYIRDFCSSDEYFGMGQNAVKNKY